MAISVELEQLLSGWLGRQPWRPRQGETHAAVNDITPMSAAQLFLRTLSDPRDSRSPSAGHGMLRRRRSAARRPQVQGLLIVLGFGEEEPARRLSVPLTLRTQEAYELRPHLIGEVDDLKLGHCFVYDGAADPEFIRQTVALIEGGRRIGEDLAAVRLSAEDAFAALPPKPVEPPRASPAEGTGQPAAPTGQQAPGDESPEMPAGDARDAQPAGGDPGAEPSSAVAEAGIELLGGERANSSAVLHRGDDPVIVKFFRTVQPGKNPAVTVPAALSEQGSGYVPGVIGWLQASWYDTESLEDSGAQVVLLSSYLTDSADAWTEAVYSAERAGEDGGADDFVERAHRIGAAVARVHTELAREFGTVSLTRELLQERLAGWRARVDWALGRVPVALAPLATPLRAHARSLEGLDVGSLHRIHGELGLSAVLLQDEEVFLVNFAAERNLPELPAEDLVDLLRSLDQAAGLVRLERTGALASRPDSAALGLVGPHELEDLVERVSASPEHAWAQAAQRALLEGYAEAREQPLDVGDRVLRAALIDRLLVEIVGELRRRPIGLEVPLSALALLLRDAGDDEGEREHEPAEQQSAD